MKLFTITFFITLFTALTCEGLLAQKIWVGNTSDNWNVGTSNNNNWNTTGVPTASQTVTIPSGTARNCIIRTAVSRTTTTTDNAGISIIGASASLTNTGAYSLADDNSISLESSATLTNNSGGTFSFPATGVANGGLYILSGTANNNTGASMTFSGGSPLQLETSGTFNNTGGTVNINSGSYLFINGGTFNNTGGTVNISSSTTGGTGTFSGSVFTNPSGSTLYDYNTFSVYSCLTFSNGLTNNGTMNFQLNGTTACTNFEKYTVTGTMTFGGTFTAAGSVALNSSLQVITYTSRIGTFTNSNASMGGGKYANVSYGANALTLNISSTPLPVEFISFDAQNTEGGKNQLLWATATEIHSQHYEVERSDDGTKFYPIGTVKAKGYGAKYDFIDLAPKAGINYYRLKQVDTDGTFSYTKTEAVETGKGRKSIKVYPTVTKDIITIEDDKLNGGAVTIFNNMGQLVFTAKQANRVDMSALPSGMYLVQVQAGNEQVVEKVFKQ
ncbi:MAG: T9SS type A sorting domain-containing protein [Saprospiraceae bacterium]|nr:T9SS type A sorting domain-containing protein [Saprospiraceae bacterium]